MATLQFGTAAPGAPYRDRPAAFGIAVQAGGFVLVRITKPGHAPWLDLPRARWLLSESTKG